MQTIVSPSLRPGHNPQIRGHRREQAFSSLTHKMSFIQRMEGLHVIWKSLHRALLFILFIKSNSSLLLKWSFLSLNWIQFASNWGALLVWGSNLSLVLLKQSGHILKKKKLKSPYLDNKFQAPECHQHIAGILFFFECPLEPVAKFG